MKMMKNLLVEAIIKYISGVVLIGLLLFLPAGTLNWSNGILFMCLLFIPMFIAGIIMYLKAPDLLKSRLNAKEKQATQKNLIKYSGLMLIASFIIAGLNYRYKWLFLPEITVTISSTMLWSFSFEIWLLSILVV